MEIPKPKPKMESQIAANSATSAPSGMDAPTCVGDWRGHAQRQNDRIRDWEIEYWAAEKATSEAPAGPDLPGWRPIRQAPEGYEMSATGEVMPISGRGQ